MFARLLSLTLLLTLTSCSWLSLHKPVIEQGNVLTSADVNKIHPGMSEKAVENILGTPVMKTLFTKNEKDYVYTYQIGNDARTQTTVICTFNRGILKSVEKR